MHKLFGGETSGTVASPRSPSLSQSPATPPPSPSLVRSDVESDRDRDGAKDREKGTEQEPLSRGEADRERGKEDEGAARARKLNKLLGDDPRAAKAVAAAVAEVETNKVAEGVAGDEGGTTPDEGAAVAAEQASVRGADSPYASVASALATADNYLDASEMREELAEAEAEAQAQAQAQAQAEAEAEAKRARALAQEKDAAPAATPVAGWSPTVGAAVSPRATGAPFRRSARAGTAPTPLSPRAPPSPTPGRAGSPATALSPRAPLSPTPGRAGRGRGRGRGVVPVGRGAGPGRLPPGRAPGRASPRGSPRGTPRGSPSLPPRGAGPGRTPTRGRALAVAGGAVEAALRAGALAPPGSPGRRQRTATAPTGSSSGSSNSSSGDGTPEAPQNVAQPQRSAAAGSGKLAAMLGVETLPNAPATGEVDERAQSTDVGFTSRLDALLGPGGASGGSPLGRSASDSDVRESSMDEPLELEPMGEATARSQPQDPAKAPKLEKILGSAVLTTSGPSTGLAKSVSASSVVPAPGANDKSQDQVKSAKLEKFFGAPVPT